jgi:hypothetical protein
MGNADTVFSDVDLPWWALGVSGSSSRRQKKRAAPANPREFRYELGWYRARHGSQSQTNAETLPHAISITV